MEKLPLPGGIAHRLGYPRVADLSEVQQNSLRFFWLDGLFASLSGALVDSYYTLYLLALGATSGQIGLANTLLQLAGAAVSVPGALLAERTGRYKLVVLSGGVLSRLMWLVMMIAPWLLGDTRAVWLVLIAWVAMSAFAALGGPAWTALSADLVPLRLRGEYFASRNIVISLARLATIPVAGLIINLIGSPGGYQLNLALALGIGAISIYYYSRLPERPPAPRTRPSAAVTRPAQPKGTRLALPREYVTFTTAHVVLMFGATIAGPFFQVFQSKQLGFDVGTIGLITTFNGLIGLVAMRLFGPWQDRRGNTWIMRFSVGIPLLPLLWSGVTQLWQGFLIEIISAVAWAGYNMGAFNLLLAATPDENRPRYVALHSTIVALAAAAGPAIGGWLVETVGFAPMFHLSGILRAVGLIVFFALVREPKVGGAPAAK